MRRSSRRANVVAHTGGDGTAVTGYAKAKDLPVLPLGAAASQPCGLSVGIGLL